MGSQCKYAIFIAVILFMTPACSAEEDLCATGNRLSVARVELKEALLDEMREEGITVQESASGEICYPAEKADYVRGKLISLDLQQRPSNHITIAGGEFARQVFEYLNKIGIEYSYIEKDHEVLIIVKNENDVQETVEVIDSVARNFFKN